MRGAKDMNLCDLVSWLTEHDNIEEVLLEDENSTLWEFDLDIKEEVFDGWDTVYPETIVIRKKE